MAFSVFLADVRPSSGSKKLSLEQLERLLGMKKQECTTWRRTQLAFLCQVTGPAKQIPPRLSFQSGIVPTRPRLTAYSGLFNKQTGIFSHLFTIFAIDGDQRASSCSGASWIGLSPIEDLVLLWRFPRPGIEEFSLFLGVTKSVGRGGSSIKGRKLVLLAIVPLLTCPLLSGCSP
jgi:hypothetical protein